jgi:hypothetical protein
VFSLLELTILIAFKDPRRHPRVAARWLVRYLQQRDQATIDEASFVLACLHALAGPEHEHAATALRAMAKTASGGRRARSVA